jgi:hypothetical protein
MKVPHVRLMMAVVMISVISVMGKIERMTDWPSTVVSSLAIVFEVLVAYFVVYRMRELHFLSGCCCLMVSILGWLILAGLLLGHADSTGRDFPLRLVTDAVAMSTLAYLLLFDRRVREYRHSLADLAKTDSRRRAH